MMDTIDCTNDVKAFITRVQNLPDELISQLRSAPNDQFLATLSSAALDARYTDTIVRHFEPILLDLTARWTSRDFGAAVAAFGRCLPFFPHLTECALRLLSSEHVDGLLRSVFSMNVALVNEDNDETLSQTHESLLGVYRLLQFDNQAFAPLVKPAKIQLLLSHRSHVIRYLAVRVVCLYLHSSDATLQDMLSRYAGVTSTDPLRGQWEQRSIDYFFFTLWEEKRRKTIEAAIRLTRSERQMSAVPGSATRLISAQDLSGFVLNVNGILLLRAEADLDAERRESNLVPTTSSAMNMRDVAQALTEPDPILITGPSGSGKSSIIQDLAQRLGQADSMLTLHLNEQSDAKLLVGIHATGSEPGSFQWYPGVLTRAVEEGRWVLIEDLDRAPNEILTTFLPLIERRDLLVTSRGETLHAKSGFRMFATIRSHPALQSDDKQPYSRILGSRFWRRVALRPHAVDELEKIVLTRSPRLRTYTHSIMAVFQRLQETLSNRKNLTVRPISTRELLKWCGRIDDILSAEWKKTGTEAVSEAALDMMFLNAIDCFLGNLEDDSRRDELMSIIAEELQFDPERASHLVRQRVVTIQSEQRGPTEYIRIGRASLQTAPRVDQRRTRKRNDPTSYFALNRHTSGVLEQVAIAVQRREPLLLVGETGIGKTAAIQYLAELAGAELLAINLSQQSEGSDLLGGYKPVNTQTIILSLKSEFDDLFESTFSQKKNHQFVELLNKCIAKGHWSRVVALWKEAIKMVAKVAHPTKSIDTSIDGSNGKQSSKRRRLGDLRTSHEAKWEAFAAKLESLDRTMARSSKDMIFEFTEGKLVKAVREGQWVLLDEINLTSPETLESLTDLLDSGPSSRPSILLTETGKLDRIEAHPNFRIFAAMNPATDVGKKELPMGIRTRFSEIFVTSPDRDVQSLQAIVDSYLGRILQSPADRRLVATATEIYQEMQRLVDQEGLINGSGERPHYSLRTLSRALQHATKIASRCNIRRALFEGFSMCFLTSLDNSSELKLQKYLLGKLFSNTNRAEAEIAKPLNEPKDGQPWVLTTLNVVNVNGATKSREEHHWLPRGQTSIDDPAHYIITPFICRNLRNLTRVLSGQRHPVLIQGPTSAGKTSMIEYLAKRSGNRFVRINNHEHTDLQEYMGSYVSKSDGQLMFQEGILVQALRFGHWLVLDELNLAPTDVLEALNRLLDDNRELLVPETQDIVRPHPNFMLFATQNPAGPYGGRKQLSRAFRNRFLELHFDDIPVTELEVILSQRSQIPPSWCSMIVEVYKRLSRLRQEQRIFEQQSFATLRDLFRWAFRRAEDVTALANNGYMLLAEKVRKEEERQAVKEIIEQVMTRKGVKIRIDSETLYSGTPFGDVAVALESGGIIMTKGMRRLYWLVEQATRHGEPALLVGETGCGKTSVCQLISHAQARPLHIVNAQQNTETGDLIGAQRPIRNRTALSQQLFEDLKLALGEATVDNTVVGEIETLLERYDSVPLKVWRQGEDINSVHARIDSNRRKYSALFEWCDGSLVQAMRNGHAYLLDEISLAEDSVLERLNSVLDPQKSILLAEKGGENALVVAQDGFQFFATMNPGGDFGKKELSPALRNRFTEIWVPPTTDADDILLIVRNKINEHMQPYSVAIVEFATWFTERYSSFSSSTVSIRDILAWVQFINTLASVHSPLSAIVQGAAMVYIDSLGANPSALIALTGKIIENEKALCISKLGELLQRDVLEFYDYSLTVEVEPSTFGIGGFNILRRSFSSNTDDFRFDTPTAKANAMRILRALQLTKPILIEGNPGVGKTSLICAIAHAIGQPLTRVNLSEQTDLIDLFGSDVPAENADAGQFVWRDAPFLSAMKTGDWVLLDEMNLASQSVLEGLNACLDHRGEVYVAELDQTFRRHPNFRLFAAQNPHYQGGGRKGLPSSFVNRFTVVYAEMYGVHDLELICGNEFPQLPKHQLEQLISFVSEVDVQVNQKRRFGSLGGPWEFNLRDLLRWASIWTSNRGLSSVGAAQDFVDLLFAQRFRTVEDSQSVRRVYETITGQSYAAPRLFTNLGAKTFQVGLALAARAQHRRRLQPTSFPDISTRHPMIESLLLCVQQNWPVILAGPSGSGKTHLLKSLAAFVGVDLEFFSLNSDIDTTDLVGGYEQVDLHRKRQVVLSEIKECAFLAIESELLRSPNSERKPVVGLLNDVIVLVKDKAIESRYGELLAIITQLASKFGNRELLQRLEKHADILSTAPSSNAVRFEWVDGMLVRALERGSWIVLDNANFCGSSVLDRLNSLLEPKGQLLINEHCTEDGVSKVVRPHPNFRIFLTMDPRHGELSRALRNRAVELYVAPLAHEVSLLTSELCTPPILESSMFRFWQVYSLIERIGTSRQNPWDYRIMLETLQAEEFDERLLQRFVDQIEAGLAEESTHREVQHVCQISKEADQRYTHWRHWSRLVSAEAVRINLLDASGRPKDYKMEIVQAQPVHPLNNEHLINKTKQDKFDFAVLASRVYELQLDFAHMYKDLSSTFNQKAKLPAFVSGGGRVDLTALLIQVLERVLVIVIGELQEQDKSITAGLRSESINGQVCQISRSLRHIQTFWWMLFKALQGGNLAESTCRALFAWGSSWSRRLEKNHDIKPVSAALESLGDYLRSVHPNTASSAGCSMRILWKYIDHPTMTSNEHLHKLLRLEQAADALDELPWWSIRSIAPLMALRTSVAEAIGNVQMDLTKVGNLCEQISTFVSTMAQGQTEAVEFDSSLRSCFEGLCQINDLRHSQKESMIKSVDNLASLSGELSLFSGRPAKLCLLEQIATQRSSQFRQTSTILESLSRYCGDASPSGEIVGLGNKMPKLLVQSLFAAQEVSLAHSSTFESMIRVLMESLAVTSNTVTVEQASVLRGALEQLYTEVMLAHEEFLSEEYLQGLVNGGLTSMEEVQRFSTITGQSYFSEIFGSHLHKCEQALLSQRRHEKVDKRILGLAFLHFAAGALYLYVPNKIIDPALQEEVDDQVHNRTLQSLRQKLDSLILVDGLTSGGSGSMRQEIVKQDMEALQAPPVTKLAVRPSVDQMNELETEFNLVLQFVQRMTKQLGSNSDFLDQAEEYLDQISRLCQRLDKGFEEYRDLTKPIAGYLHCAKVGIALLLCHMEDNSTSNISSQLLENTPFIGSNTLRITPFAGWTKTLQADDYNAALLQRLQVLALWSTLQSPADWPGHAKRELSEILNHLYTVWKLQLVSDQHKTAKNSSLYDYRGSAEDDDRELEEEFYALFPDEDSSSDGTERRPYLEQATMDPRALASKVATLHLEIFQHTAPPLSSALKLFDSTFDLLRAKQSDYNLHIGLEQLLPSIFLQHASRRANLTSSLLENEYNIYTDPNFAEGQKLLSLLHEIQTRFREILESWPENEVLQNVLNCCTEVSAFKRHEPLMKIITKCEQLHTFMDEWQRVASREFNANDVYNKLTDLLVRWRQLELSTWSRLLDFESEKCREDAMAWWFVAFENVVAIPSRLASYGENMNNHVVTLVQALESFITKSTIGQFEPRIQILQALASLLRIEDADAQLNGVRAAVHNAVAHFQRMIPAVVEAINKKRKELEKEVYSVLKLASWKDRNIHSLQQSAKASHRKLFRIIRKYRNLLSSPAAPVLGQATGDFREYNNIVQTKPKAEHIFLAEPELVALCSSFQSAWKQRPLRYQNVSATTRAIQKRTSITGRKLDPASMLKDFESDIDHSIRELQKATPETLTKDNASSVKHLTARKRKVFADTLKSVRQMGMRSNIGADQISTQDSLAKVLANLPDRILKSSDPELDESRQHLHNYLALMIHVRDASRNHHEDLTAHEASRCTGYLESFLLLLIRQQQRLASFSKQANELRDTIHCVDDMKLRHDNKVQICPPQLPERLESTKKLLDWLPTVIRIGMKALEAQSSLGKLDFSALIQALSSWTAAMDDLRKTLNNIGALPPILVTDYQDEVISQANQTVAIFREDLAKWSIEAPLAKPTLKQIQQWTVHIPTTSSNEQSAVNGHSSIRADDFNSCLFATLDEVLGCVQDVEVSKAQLPESVEESDWLVKEDSAQISMLTSYHVPNVLRSINSLFSRAKHLREESGADLYSVCASLTLAAPILEQYLASFEVVLSGYVEFHKSVCMTSHLLAKSFTSLATNGFCKPAEKSDEKQAGSEKLESGTGLGDGEGAEDNSKDIGDDEDISDLAEDSENKKQGGEMENVDDAVSIEDELEGAAGEDMGQEEGESKENAEEEDGEAEDKDDISGEGGQEEGDNTEKNGLGEGIGEIDDLGPSAVDEKLWDEAGESEQKEMEGNQASGEEKKDEKVASTESAKALRDEHDAAAAAEENDDETGSSDKDHESDAAEQDDADTAGQQEVESTDPNLKDSEGLNLPEDLQLDGDKTKQEDDSSDKDMLDEIENEPFEEGSPEEFEHQKSPSPDVEDVGISGDQTNETMQEDDTMNPDAQQESRNNEDQPLPGIDETMDDYDYNEPGTGQARSNQNEQASDKTTEHDARGAGPDEAPEDPSNFESSAQRRSGVESRVARQQQASAREEAENPESKSRSEEARSTASKSAGDSTQQWHRRQQQIQEYTSNRDSGQAQQQDVDMAEADFEHLPDNNADADTQALGPASHEQAKALDDSMAIAEEDGTQHGERDDFMPNMESEDEDKMQTDDQAFGNTDEQQFGAAPKRETMAFIGTRAEQESNREGREAQGPVEEVNDSLSTMQIEPVELSKSPESMSVEEALRLWNHHTTLTHGASLILTEQLRLILEPTLATKLRGDFRTGKRLNMKRIIPYIASGYKRDKIWMRRTAPTKRAYQVLVAVDDSQSMLSLNTSTTISSSSSSTQQHGQKSHSAASLAFSTLALLSRSLTALEVGDLAILSFGANVSVAHPFSQPFTPDAGADILRRFSFAQRTTDVNKLLATSLAMLAEARDRNANQGGARDLWQLQLIVSDGVFEDHERVRRTLLRAREARVLVVFVVVDASDTVTPGTAARDRGAPQTQKQSILDLEKVEFTQDDGIGAQQGDMTLKRTRYLDTFPFPYYLIVKDVGELPHVLALALRQWFAEVAAER